MQVAAECLGGARRAYDATWAGAEAARRDQLTAQRRCSRDAVRVIGAPQRDCAPPDLELPRLPASHLEALEQLHESATVGLRPDEPLHLGIGGRPRGDGVQRAEPGRRAQPLQKRRVVVADPKRHQAPERLPAVGLGDPEMTFALDEPRYEVALSFRNRPNHLQIVAFRGGGTLVRCLPNTSYRACKLHSWRAVTWARWMDRGAPADAAKRERPHDHRRPVAQGSRLRPSACVDAGRRAADRVSQAVRAWGRRYGTSAPINASSSSASHAPRSRS